MAIVSAEYYKTVYLGQEASECDFPAMEARAEDMICALTGWRISAETFAGLSAFQQTMFKKAVCAQVDFFGVNGLDSLSGTGASSFTVGKVSVTKGAGSVSANAGMMRSSLAPMAMMYLEQSGLLNPAVPVASASSIAGCC